MIPTIILSAKMPSPGPSPNPMVQPQLLHPQTGSRVLVLMRNTNKRSDERMAAANIKFHQAEDSLATQQQLVKRLED